MKKLVLFILSSVLGLIGVLILGVILSFYRVAVPMSKEAQVYVTIIFAPTPTATEEPTPIAYPTGETQEGRTAENSGIRINSIVKVSGTQGDGLRLREEAGLGNTILSLASESEMFVVLDGPREADGFKWWYIADPSNEKRRGWAAENYLHLIE